MRAWAIVLAVAVVQCYADTEDTHRKSRKVGSFVETIGAADLAIKENGKARFTFWEKTSPNLDKPKISCGLKTNVPGNYSLTIVRPDLSTEIFLVTMEPSEGESEGSSLKAYFPVNMVNLRPSEIHIRLLQGAEDEDGLLLGTVQITSRAVARTKRDEASRQVIRKMSKILRKNKKNKDKKENIDDKLEVREFTTSSEAAKGNSPIRQAPSEVKKRNKKASAKKSKGRGKKVKPNKKLDTNKKNKGRKKKKNKENKQQQEELVDNLRQKHTLKAKEEAIENPIKIDFTKQRKPKSMYSPRVAENSLNELQKEVIGTTNNEEGVKIVN